MINWSHSIYWGGADEANRAAPHRSKVTADTSSPTKIFLPFSWIFLTPFCRQKEVVREGGKGQVIPAQNNHEAIISCLSQLRSVLTPGQKVSRQTDYTIAQTAITKKIVSRKFTLEEWGYLGWGRTVKRKKAHLIIPVNPSKPMFLRYYQPHISCSL